MTYGLRITERALSDIQRNASWWAQHRSPSEALSWFEAILERINRLVDFPKSHTLAHENPHVAYDLREAHFGSGYRILFTVVDNEVVVLTIKATEEEWLQPGDLPPVAE